MDEQSANVAAAPSVGGARLAIGLAQGLIFYGLAHAFQHDLWPATDGPLFGALALASAYAPLVLLAGLGHLRRLTLAIWVLAAAGVTAALAAHSVATALPPPFSYASHSPADILPSLPAAAFIATALFIAHHLIVPADAERRLVARYPRYFDAAWLNGVQLALAIAFTGAFWILLQLGAALFDLIGIKGFHTLISHDWFYFPATTVMFAAAVHLGDVRVGLTRGLRTVGLILLSWLLPLMTAIAVAFLIALPFTGLAVLWRANPATSELLTAVAALIVLVNAAYQDGGETAQAPIVLRWAARITAIAILPMTGLAVYGLAVRIGQHGLTPQRIIAGACALVAACYAAGYAFAAIRPGRWMGALESTNLAAAILIVGLIIALFSPIADPARLSVDDQVGRLERGATAPDKFDWRFLHFRSGVYGDDALKRLAATKTGPKAIVIAAIAASELIATTRDTVQAPPIPMTPLAQRLTVYPKGASLPADFLSQVWPADDVPCRFGACDAYMAARPGATALVLLDQGATLQAYAKQKPSGPWTHVGEYLTFTCPGEDQGAELRAGHLVVAPHEIPDLIVGRHRLVPDTAGLASYC